MERALNESGFRHAQQLMVLLPQHGLASQFRTRDGSFEVLKEHFLEFATRTDKEKSARINLPVELPSFKDVLVAAELSERTFVPQIIPQAVYSHPTTESLEENKYFYCHWGTCKAAFNTRSGLATHCSDAHLLNNIGSTDTKRRKLELRCGWNHCREEFQTFKQLMKHLALPDHIGQAPYLSKQKETEALRHQDEFDPRRKFYCSFPGCGKSFTDSSNRKKHERIHDANRIRYKCTQVDCGKSYTTKADLNVHFRVHKQLRDNKCTYPNCDKTFVRTSELYAHERTHDNILPHVCDLCGKGFRETTRLKKHQQEHQWNLVPQTPM